AVYATRNVSHAARLLGMSQPTVSNALTRLRAALDDQLFVRSANEMKPTTRAINLIGPVRESLRMLRSGLGEETPFDPSRTARHFRFVLLDPLEPVFIPPVLEEIQNHRAVTLEALPYLGVPVAEGLSDGSIDLVLATYLKDIPDINCAKISTAEVVVVTRKDHPALDGPITMEQFSALGQIALTPKLRSLSLMDEELSRRGVDRHIVYCVTKFWSFPHIIANSELIGMLPGGFARAAAESYPLDIHPLPFELSEQNLYLSWKKHREGDAGLMWLRDKFLSVLDGIE
ncbi:MAG: LysR family transcriptional regulator, partial [Pseudomonadota bacterium]